MTEVKESAARKAADQLYWDSRIDCDDIKVDATGDVITLSGSVPDYQMVYLAESDVLSLPNVKGVHNKLKVKPKKKKAQYSDSQIKSNIENALSYNSNIDATNIRVSVAEGNVVLEGSVDAYRKKILVEEIVPGISEVSGLNSLLTVVPTQKQSDAAIAEAIVAALNRNKWVDPDRIDVVVENGVATLSGTVMNWAALRGANDIAAYTPGVIDIRDNLKYE